MSRWRESSGLSLGSQIVPPGESSSGKACDRRTRFSKSSIVASRRVVALAHERAAVDRGEGHVLAAEVDASARGCAPAGRTRAAPWPPARARTRGRGSRDLPSTTCWPAARNASTASSSRNSIPISVDDPPPAAVEDRHGVLAEDLVARHRVDEHSCTSRVWLDERSGGRHAIQQWNCSSSRRGTGLPRERAGSGHAVDRPCRRDARAPARQRRADEPARPRRGRRPAQEHRLAPDHGARAPRPRPPGRRARQARARPGDPALRPPRRPRAPPRRAGPARARGDRRGQRRDGQPLGPHPQRRRPPRPGRRPPLPRRRPVGRAPRRLPLHRQRQGLPRLRRGRVAPRAAGAADDGHGRQPRRARRRARARAPRRLRHRRRRARGRPERDRRARPRADRRRHRRAQHLGPDAAPDAARVAELHPSSSSRRARSRSASASTDPEREPHDARGDPAGALRRHARRQGARGEGQRRGAGSSRAWSPRACSSTPSSRRSRRWARASSAATTSCPRC